MKSANTFLSIVAGVALLFGAGCVTTPSQEQIEQFTFDIKDVETTRAPQSMMSDINLTTGEWGFYDATPKEGFVFVIVRAIPDFHMRGLKVHYEKDLYLQTKTGEKRKGDRWFETKRGHGFIPATSEEWKRDKIAGEDIRLLFVVREADFPGSVIRFYDKTIPLTAR